MDVLAVLMSLAVFVCGLALAAALFRAQVRRYNRAVATDLLNDWYLQLQLLDDDDRERALLSPPPNVLAAVASLPARGFRSGWGDGPVAFNCG
jgi:hypothetical protein